MLPPSSVLNHVLDAHCHPTDSAPISSSALEQLQITICAMSTRQSDQSEVRLLAERHPTKVVPCFGQCKPARASFLLLLKGYHPWFSHSITLKSGVSKETHYRQLLRPQSEQEFEHLLLSLPIPVALEDLISELRHNLKAFPHAMLGEVGLDRAFRLPIDYFAYPRQLTSFTIPIDHQLAILEAQLELAVELGRNVSLHSVKAQQATLQLIDRLSAEHGERWRNISIDMHSCGLSAQMWREMEVEAVLKPRLRLNIVLQKKHPNIFMSLSTVINSRSENHISLVKACSDNRILVESDFHDIEKCTERTWEMVQIVARVKGWDVESEWVDDIPEDEWGVVHRLEENWRLFKRGRHTLATRQKKNVVQEWLSESEED